MATRIMDADDALDLLVVKVEHEPMMGHACDRWKITYASGRESYTTDADHVQSIMQNKPANRRTMR